jgi:hypothetical protein
VSTGLLDVVADTLDAFSNIAFILHFTVCLLIVITSVCAKSIYYRKNIITNLQVLCNSAVQARLGGMLR